MEVLELTHAACFALVIIAAYKMYNECADGLLDDDWKVEVKVQSNSAHL